MEKVVSRRRSLQSNLRGSSFPPSFRKGAQLVKAFGTLSAGSLATGANRSPKRAVLFYATDRPEAGKTIAKLIAASGFSPLNVGGIDKSIRIEVGGDLHEFGKLGKLVSTKEAEALS
jgi:8-hydroxy-5-deazaflavin:NADPH oxidoreductase